MVGSSLDKGLDKIIGSLGGRLFVAATQTILFSVFLLLAFTLKQYVEISLLKYVIAIAVGTMAGFSARRFLTGHYQVLKVLVSALSSALSLSILNILSNGFLGIDLLNQLNGTPDWSGLIQFGMAVIMAWLTIQAFRSPLTIKDIPAQKPQVSSPVSRTVKHRALPKPRPTAAKKTSRKISGTSAKKKAALSVKKTKTQNAAPLAIAKTKTKSPKNDAAAQKLSVAPSSSLRSNTKRSARPNTKRIKKKKDIKFTGVEEHSCPYCLDPVEPHDARGVKICPICKTHHHADCWGITGACQIPHSH